MKTTTAGLELTNGKLILPGWFIAALMVIASIFVAGVSTGAQIKEVTQQISYIDYRTCRIEARLGLDKWPTCPSIELPKMTSP